MVRPDLPAAIQHRVDGGEPQHVSLGPGEQRAEEAGVVLGELAVHPLPQRLGLRVEDDLLGLRLECQHPPQVVKERRPLLRRGKAAAIRQ